MGLIDKIVYKLSGGYFNPVGLTDVSSAGILTNRDMYQTHEGIGRIYVIDQMPFHRVEPFLSELNNAIQNIRDDIVMKSFIDVINIQPQINNPVFTARMNKTLDVYTIRKEAYEKQSAEQQVTGVHSRERGRTFRYTRKHLDEDRRKYESFTSVYNHIRNNDGVFFHVNLLIHVVFPDRIAMDANEIRVEKLIQNATESSYMIDKQIAKHMLNYSPSISGVYSLDVNPLLVSDVNLTHLLPYGDEGVLSDRGILIGMNIENNTPLFLDVFGSPVGSSTLIGGKSGRGKSSIGYYYTTQLVANDVTVIYIDLKGSEVYEVLTQVSSMVHLIDFGHNDSTFINTMHLSKNVPDYTYADAIHITSQMLSIFVDLQPNEGNIQDLYSILNGAIKSYYNFVGVSEENPDTYINSLKMNYHELMSYIGIQRDHGTKTDLDKLFAVTERRLPAAVITYGLNKNENAINLDILFGYSIIIFSLNKNQEVSLSLIDQVRVYMALMVTKRVAKYNKKNGLFTTVMAEEAQRYHGLPVLSQGISDLASGSRSDNLNVCMLMNDLNVLRANEFSGFRANIANFIIGDCEGDAVGAVRDLFKKDQLADVLEELIANPKKYSYTFAMYFDNGIDQILTKMRCNASPTLLEKFKTRDVINEAV